MIIREVFVKLLLDSFEKLSFRIVMLERDHLMAFMDLIGSKRDPLITVSFMRILRLREVARMTARIALEFAPDYAFSVSLLLTPLCCDDIHDVTPRVSALAGCDIFYSDYQYVVSIKEDTAYPCLHSPKTTKETCSIRRIQKTNMPYWKYGMNIIFWNISNVVPTPRNSNTPYPTHWIRRIEPTSKPYKYKTQK
ncbi:hypothetical protein Tco_0806766 [Tanacetum coccineum]